MCGINYCTKVFVCLGPFYCFIVDNEVEAYVVPDQSVVVIVEHLVSDMFCCFGVLKELHGDKDE